MSDDGWLEAQARAGAKAKRRRAFWSSLMRPKAPAQPRPQRLSPEEVRIENALRTRVGTWTSHALFAALFLVGAGAPWAIAHALGIDLTFPVYFASSMGIIAVGFVASLLATGARYADSQRRWLRSLPFPLSNYPGVLGNNEPKGRLEVRVQFVTPPAEAQSESLINACLGALGSRISGAHIQEGALVLTSTLFETMFYPEDGDPYVSNGPLHVWSRAVLTRFVCPLHRRVSVAKVSFRHLAG